MRKYLKNILALPSRLLILLRYFKKMMDVTTKTKRYSINKLKYIKIELLATLSPHTPIIHLGLPKTETPIWPLRKTTIMPIRARIKHKAWIYLLSCTQAKDRDKSTPHRISDFTSIVEAKNSIVDTDAELTSEMHGSSDLTEVGKIIRW